MLTLCSSQRPGGTARGVRDDAMAGAKAATGESLNGIVVLDEPGGSEVRSPGGPPAASRASGAAAAGDGPRRFRQDRCFRWKRAVFVYLERVLVAIPEATQQLGRRNASRMP
jgi:hypothetical protein